MVVKALQGAEAPIKVTRPAAEPGAPSLIPPPVEAFAGQVDVIVTPDTKYPVYTVALWLISPSGRGRNSVLADLRGNVAPHIQIMQIHCGSPGVEVSKLDDRQLNLEGFWVVMASRGWARVDHLQDEKGEQMGLPDRATVRSEKLYEWRLRVLNPARLRQLQRELGRSENGRGFRPDWMPNVPRNIEKILGTPRKKEPAQRDFDLELLKGIRAKIAEIGGKVRAAAQVKSDAKKES